MGGMSSLTPILRPQWPALIATLAQTARDALKLLLGALGVMGAGFVASLVAALVVDHLAPVHLQGGAGAAPGMVVEVTSPPQSGPSESDIKGAAERAVAARYAATAGFGKRAALASLRVFDRRPTATPGTWAVRMALSIKMVPAVPLADPQPHRGLYAADEVPPRWVAVAWSGQHWFISDYEF